MIDFSNVTDVKIPEGDVVRIAEASSGRILWEKNSPPVGHWELVKNVSYMTGFADYGSETGKLLFCDKDYTYIYDAKASTLSQHYKIIRPDGSAGVSNYIAFMEIVPESKVCFICVNSGATSISNNNYHILYRKSGLMSPLEVIGYEPYVSSNDFFLQSCCWSPDLKHLCTVGDRNMSDTGGIFHVNSSLYSASGELVLKNRTLSEASEEVGNQMPTRPKMAYSTYKHKFVVTTGSNTVKVSLDGLSWREFYVTDNDYEYVVDVCECGRLGFLASTLSKSLTTVPDEDKRAAHVYKSSDGEHWEKVLKLTNKTEYINGTNVFLAAPGVEALVGWSSDKGVACVITSGITNKVGQLGYTSRDLKTWTLIESGVDGISRSSMSTFHTSVKWSKTLGGFVMCTQGETPILKIDN